MLFLFRIILLQIYYLSKIELFFLIIYYAIYVNLQSILLIVNIILIYGQFFRDFLSLFFRYLLLFFYYLYM